MAGPTRSKKTRPQAACRPARTNAGTVSPQKVHTQAHGANLAESMSLRRMHVNLSVLDKLYTPMPDSNAKEQAITNAKATTIGISGRLLRGPLGAQHEHPTNTTRESSPRSHAKPQTTPATSHLSTSSLWPQCEQGEHG